MLIINFFLSIFAIAAAIFIKKAGVKGIAITKIKLVISIFFIILIVFCNKPDFWAVSKAIVLTPFFTNT